MLLLNLLEGDDWFTFAQWVFMYVLNEYALWDLCCAVLEYAHNLSVVILLFNTLL